MAKTKEVTVSVTKTFQFVQYEPSVVTITEVITLSDKDDVEKETLSAHKRVSSLVEKCLIREGKRYDKTKS